MSTTSQKPAHRPRVTTIVWGSVILVIALLLLVSQFVDLAVDPVVVALGLLVGVGLALVIGGALSLRSRAAEDHRDDDPLSDHEPRY